MSRINRSASFWLLLPMLLGSCTSLPFGKLPAECSGVPGDFRTPGGMLAPGKATHGPGADGKVIELTAVARPLGSTMIPLLYIYGPDAENLFGNHPYADLLKDPAFVQVEAEAYWGEIVDNAYYRVPWLDKCSQAAMLEPGVSFRAPPEGILFMQFQTAFCSECRRITRAIDAFIASNPDMPVRWVRVSVPGRVGALHK
jgi:hypothetical protein